jgi:phage protein D/phage baseplate assembly protein gpV
MPALASEQHVASLGVKVSGARLDARWMDSVLEVRVKGTLGMPGTASLRLSDPDAGRIDSQPFRLGADVEISMGALDDTTPDSVFKGQVVAIEPEFTEKGCVIGIRALEYSHKLHMSRKPRTFVQMKAEDIVRKVLSELGLQAGTVDATNLVYDFLQQADESDWQFLNRLAVDHDREIVAEGQRIHFRKAGKGAGAELRLKWMEGLVSFRPRIGAVQQPSTVNVRGWDAKGKRAIAASASGPTPNNQAGIARSQAANALGQGALLVSDRTVQNQQAAQALAKSTIDRLADSYVEAEGSTLGTPDIRAGAKVKIEGVGSTFGGSYVVTSAEHVFRGGTGFTTRFAISGRSPRTLLDLMRPPQRREWSDSFVVGVVSNTNDPEQQGRVKVNFPALADDHESTWARVVVPSAGPANRGLYMLPQPGDEVVVAFENGDPQRPYVLGCVFGGKDKPGTDLLQNKDGSFALKSDKKIWMKAVEDIEIKSDKSMIVTITKDLTEKESGNYTNEATGNTKLKAQQIAIEAGGSVSIKGVSITVEASASLTLKGATVTVQGSGPTSIKGNPIAIG